MRKTNWKKVNEVLEEVLAFKSNEREDFLKNADIDKNIREEVELLLSFEKAAESSMNLSAIEFSKGFIDYEEENPLIGQNIGEYIIEKELGYGGMGAVYLANRADGKFEQRVALKLLKREMNTAALRRRFQIEREILATLEHPNIARLLNAGTTEDKIPYIAMEYVEGLPIDDYCNKHDLDLNQRLNLFRKVCSAVDFAHRNLVVHRDLKPSNILVTEDGTPKLLDFGISKILSEDFSQINKATVTNMGVMTPSYASPEQLKNKSVTTATDIYSLGVILYEILCGHRPFEDKEDDIKQIYNAVIENEPPLPSAIINTFSKKFKEITEAKTEIKESEKSETRNVKNNTDSNQAFITKPNKNTIKSNLLKGDLDNIILKALKKEPERRYSSAENFAEDIKRHQKGNPVTARPDTFSYRASKFIKRNSLAVGATGLILLAILGGIFATLWQARVAQAERAKAEKRFKDVRKLANSLLFEITPTIEKVPGTTEARELLVKRSLEYLDSLAEESGDDTELQKELATAYEKVGSVQGSAFNTNVGDVGGSLKSYEKARKIRKDVLAKNPDYLNAKKELANNCELIGDIHFQGGENEKILEFYNEALALRKEILDQNPNDFEARINYAKILDDVGLTIFYQENYEKAIEFYLQAQEILKKLNQEKPDDKNIARGYYTTILNIGEAREWNNQVEEAEVNLLKAVELFEKLAEKHKDDQSLKRPLFIAYYKIGEHFDGKKEYKKSIKYYSDALELAEQAAQKDEKDVRGQRDVALMGKNLAQALGYDGRSRESLEKLQSVLEVMEEIKVNDPQNTEAIYDVATVHNSICDVYLDLKDFSSAINSCEIGKKIFNNSIEKNPGYFRGIRALALTHKSIGRAFEGLSEKGNRQTNLQKALDNFNTSVKILKQLDSKGNLSELDKVEIPEIEEMAKKVEKKLG